MFALRIFEIMLLLFFSNGNSLDLPFCELINGKGLECSGFTSFNQLNFTNLTVKTDYILLEPLIKLRLDSDLNLTSLNRNQTNKLILKNLNGFDATYNPFVGMSQLLSLEIVSSDWQFDFNCSDDHLNEKLLFEGLDLNELHIKEPQFMTSLCPLLFRNTTIRKLLIQSISPVKFDSLNDLTTDIYADIMQLEIIYGYSYFLQVLNSESILNEYLFKSVQLIEINQCYLQSIDTLSLAKLTHLRELRLIGFDLKKLFDNGMDWLESINLNSIDYFILKFSINILYKLEYGDDEFCYFQNFPHDRLILPLFYYNENDFESPELEYLLPCSCTIYWLYRDTYKMASDYFSNLTDRKYFPVHCFSIDQALIDEQLDFCKNELRAEECQNKTTIQISTTTSTPDPKTICDYCKCTFTASDLNLLECNNASLVSWPANFKVNSSFQFNYVSLVGSSIERLDESSFKNLRLKENASIVVDNIKEFENNIFRNSLNYTKQFSFSVYNSSLATLYLREPFRNVNLSRLEFIGCKLPESFSILGFVGSYINLLSISKPVNGSVPPFFRRTFTVDDIHVFKFEIKDVFNIFRTADPQGKFGIDFFLLNEKLFKYLEELIIMNTFVDYIESNSFLFLKNLRIVRLENVNLKNIIDFYFVSASLMDTIDFDNEAVNWLANTQIERVYLGREQFSETKFNYENEYLCYFAGLTANKQVFIYDSIDYFIISKFECTCTVFWLYSKLNDLEGFLATDYDAKRYVPECIQNLKTSFNVRKQLDMCLNGTNPNEYCRIVPTTSVKSTTTVEYSSTYNDSTSLNSLSFLATSTNAENKLDPIVIQNVLISLLFFTIFLFLLVAVGMVLLLRIKMKQIDKSDSNNYELNHSYKI